MADIVLSQGQSLPQTMRTRYHDMDDGTHAQVVAVQGTAASRATPRPQAITLTAANTQYTVAIPVCAGYEFRARTSAVVRYAYATGRVAGPTDPYLTLAEGEQFYAPMPLQAHTLYLASATAGTVVELLVYEV